MPLDRSSISSTISRAGAVVASLDAQSDLIHAIIERLRACFASGGTLYTCGNGGSAAEALHLSEELIGKFDQPREPLPAVCLNADPTALTCIANDYGFDEVFARQVRALAGERDVVLVFSTSGNSPNLVRALEAAMDRGAATIGLLGKGGGPCAPLCDLALIVDAQETQHIQEAHQVVLHLLLGGVEAS